LYQVNQQPGASQWTTICVVLNGALRQQPRCQTCRETDCQRFPYRV
jgi:hypothetical protein